MKIKKTKWFSPIAYVNNCTLGKMEKFNVDEVSGKGAKLTREDVIEIAEHFNIIKN